MQEAYNNNRILGNSLIFISVVIGLVGLYARFKGLGLWPFANDEYHTAQSIANILKLGYPGFECGGYYMRGILFQYLNAMVLSISQFSPEFTMRSVNVLTSLIALPAIYLIATKHGNRTIALLSLCLLLLSVWEIEIARYLRMYAPFQSIFIWYIYFLFEYMLQQKQKYFVAMLSLSTCALFVYEASVFLVLLNFFALLQWGSQRLKLNLFINGISLVLAVWLFKTNFRFMGVANPLPSDITLPPDLGIPLPIEIPHILLTAMPFGSLWFIGFCTLLLLASVSTFFIVKNHDINWICRLLIVIAILSLVVNQFFFAACLTIICILLNWCRIQDLYSDKLLLFSLTGILFFVFWTAFGATTDSWYHFFDDTAQKPLKKLAVVLTKYPDIYIKIFHQWFSAMPITTAILIMSIMLGSILALLDGFKKNEFYLTSIALIFILTLWIAMLKQPYESARYSSFYYPLVLILFVKSLDIILQKFVSSDKQKFAAICLGTFAFMIVSDDYSYKHLLNIDKAEYNFRDVYDLDRGGQLFYRMDFRSPAHYINKHADKKDTIISTVLGFHYYLDKLDYMFVDYRHSEFTALSSCNGKKELWTNANLLYKEEKFINFLRNPKNTTWLIIRTKHFPYTPKLENDLAIEFSKNKVYTSIDNDYAVYKITQN